MVAWLILGVFIGWFSMLLTAVLVTRKLVRNPPEAVLKAIGRNMAKQVTKSVRHTP